MRPPDDYRDVTPKARIEFLTCLAGQGQGEEESCHIIPPNWAGSGGDAEQRPAPPQDLGVGRAVGDHSG